MSNRSNEWSIEMDEYDVRLMRPCVTTLLPMYQVLNETKFDYSHISPHYHYKDGFSSVRNIFCSLRTQQVLASSIQTHATALGVTYDAVATFRPDTAVVRDLDLASLLATRKFSAKHIYLPNFAHFKGVNDRSAYGSQAVMTTYLNRQYGNIFEKLLEGTQNSGAQVHCEGGSSESRWEDSCVRFRHSCDVVSIAPTSIHSIW